MEMSLDQSDLEDASLLVECDDSEQAAEHARDRGGDQGQPILRRPDEMVVKPMAHPST